MSNFQCLGVKQAKSTSVCCGIPLVLLQERREGGGHKESFCDPVLFAFQQWCSSTCTAFSYLQLVSF